MSTTRYLLLAGLVLVALTVWKVSSGGGMGDVKVSGRDSSEQIAEISSGERVEVGDHIASTGRTLFELGAEW